MSGAHSAGPCGLDYVWNIWIEEGTLCPLEWGMDAGGHKQRTSTVFALSLYTKVLKKKINKQIKPPVISEL